MNRREVKEKADQNWALLETELIVDRESVVGAIVDYAEHQKIDIIVLGSRGLGTRPKIISEDTLMRGYTKNMRNVLD